ncbi:Protein of unknown function [Alteromonadaceae bacterium Bs31]|nr:Protein of unknown function [Alteromonadaceae bacterium Bs31]
MLVITMKKDTIARFWILIVLMMPVSLFAEQFCQPENILSTAPGSRYDIRENGTVEDKNTGLVWLRCVQGKSGENCQTGSAIELTWAAALQYIAKVNEKGVAGYSDWRMPNIRELSTLVELQCVEPAISLDAFPFSPASHVWSSSPYHFYTHYSWYVDFTNGAATYDERIVNKQLRLVRDAN